MRRYVSTMRTRRKLNVLTASVRPNLRQSSNTVTKTAFLKQRMICWMYQVLARKHLNRLEKIYKYPNVIDEFYKQNVNLKTDMQRWSYNYGKNLMESIFYGTKSFTCTSQHLYKADGWGDYCP